jgi:hypothetical protein
MSSQSAQQADQQKEAAQAVEHQAETTIEAAADAAPDDQSYETDFSTSATTSISSSVRNYDFEHGRRYHRYQEGRYLFPNDEPEQEREDMKHAMIINLCGGRLHYAPLENPQEILDIGTGTGIWAIDSMSNPSFRYSNGLSAISRGAFTDFRIQWETNTRMHPYWVLTSVRSNHLGSLRMCDLWSTMLKVHGFIQKITLILSMHAISRHLLRTTLSSYPRQKRKFSTTVNI